MRYTLMMVAIGATFHCLPSHAETLPRARFQYQDWELACDNTRTCRAAGYHADGATERVSVMLERKAGADERIGTLLQLGETEDDGALPTSLRMLVDEREVGDVLLHGRSAVLSPKQTEALLKGVAGTARVAWRGGGKTWILSGKGATAVLLKMDEFQGRLDTPGAAVRKGRKDNRDVLPPLPVPMVEQPAMATDRIAALEGEEKRLLYVALRAAASDDCMRLDTIASGEQDFNYAPLDEKRMLVSAPCWRGAYNTGHGFWVVNRTSPFSPTPVTEFGTEYMAGIIGASHRGRGIGDCWANDAWAWDGRRFVHVLSASTGMCREISSSGAWTMPALVRDVRQAGGQTKSR